MANDQTITKGVAYVILGGPDGVEITGGKAYVVTALTDESLAILSGKAYLVTSLQTGDLAGTADIDVRLTADLDAQETAVTGRRRFMVVAGP